MSLGDGPLSFAVGAKNTFGIAARNSLNLDMIRSGRENFGGSCYLQIAFWHYVFRQRHVTANIIFTDPIAYSLSLFYSNTNFAVKAKFAYLFSLDTKHVVV